MRRDFGITRFKLVVLIALFCPLGVVLWMAFQPRRHPHHSTYLAVGLLNRMWAGSLAYYEADHFAPDGKLLPKQFPGPRGASESTTACGCLPQGRCPGGSSVWAQDPVWLALGFSLPDSHLYIPGYTSSGIGTNATFTAYTKGDLDCDGSLSEFWRIGHVDSGGKVVGNYQPIIKKKFD